MCIFLLHAILSFYADGDRIMTEFFENIAAYFAELSSTPLLIVQDMLDIFLLALMIYAVLRFIRDSRASQLLRGIILLVLILEVTKLLNLTGSHYILSRMLEYGVLALLIVFQPELRSVLERVGRKSFSLNTLFSGSAAKQEEEKLQQIDSICNAVANLSATKTGALIVLERETKLGELAATGICLDADISAELIQNIFFPNASLHDGAMLIKNGRIHCAGCFLPLSSREVSSDLGTRHRAAIGVSEISDATVLVVSEETGIISVAENGTLTRRLTPDALRAKLIRIFLPKKPEKKKKDFLSGLWKGKKQ